MNIAYAQKMREHIFFFIIFITTITMSSSSSSLSSSSLSGHTAQKWPRQSWNLDLAPFASSFHPRIVLCLLTVLSKPYTCTSPDAHLFFLPPPLVALHMCTEQYTAADLNAHNSRVPSVQLSLSQYPAL